MKQENKLHILKHTHRHNDRFQHDLHTFYMKINSNHLHIVFMYTNLHEYLYSKFNPIFTEKLYVPHLALYLILR